MTATTTAFLMMKKLVMVLQKTATPMVSPTSVKILKTATPTALPIRASLLLMTAPSIATETASLMPANLQPQTVTTTVSSITAKPLLVQPATPVVALLLIQ